MKKNNRGFTILELMFGFALLGIVAVIISGFITSAANTYRNVSSEVNLQYESQLAMNQLQGYLINCNAGMCVQGGTLYVVNRDQNGEYKVYKFEKTPGGNKLKIYAADVKQEGGNITYSFDTVSEMASYVNGFSIRLTTNADATLIKTVTPEIDFSSGNKTYTGMHTVTMRNQVANASAGNLDTLLKSIINP